MFDYSILFNNTDNPGLISVLVTMLFAFFLSSLIVITYDLTTKGVQRSDQFLQAMSLISIVAAMIMQAIGDSLARGLGMLGALAIIRFRTNMDNPRNITFMFAALATGIACGVYGFSIALVGTVTFCLVAFILRLTPYGNGIDLIGDLRVEIESNEETRKELEGILKEMCSKYRLETYRNIVPKAISSANPTTKTEYFRTRKESTQELTYLLKLKRKFSEFDLTNRLEAHGKIMDVRLRFQNNRVRL